MSILARSISVVCQGTVTSSSGHVCKVANCFSYYTLDALGAGTIGLFMATFEPLVWSPIVSLFSTDYVGDPYRVYFPGRVFNGGGTLFGAGLNGGTAGDRLPTSLAVNMVLRTAARSRHYLGLKRFGPVVSADVDGDELNAAGLARWSAVAPLLSNLLVDGFSHTWRPVVQSRELTAAVPVGALIDGEEITTIDLNKTLGFARHRREPTSR